jgi:hypothetical protein
MEREASGEIVFLRQSRFWSALLASITLLSDSIRSGAPRDLFSLILWQYLQVVQEGSSPTCAQDRVAHACLPTLYIQKLEPISSSQDHSPKKTHRSSDSRLPWEVSACKTHESLLMAMAALGIWFVQSCFCRKSLYAHSLSLCLVRYSTSSHHLSSRWWLTGRQGAK